MPVLSPLKRFRFVVATCLVLVLVPVITVAETHVGSKSANSQEVSGSSGDELAPAVAYGEDIFMVVWEYAYSGADHDVYLRLVSPTGTPEGVSIGVVTSALWEGSPAVAYSEDSGNFLVVWEQVNALGDWDIVGQLYGTDASAVGSRLEIAAGTSEQRRPAVAWGDGRWLVVWEHQVTAVINDLRGLLLEDDGTAIGSELVVASGEADESAPAVAFGGSRFLVAWQDEGAAEYDIVARTVAANGDLGSASALVSWEYAQIRPSLAYSAEDESFLVVWEDHHWGWGADWDIYARRVDTDGAAVGSLLAISWEGDDPRTAPSIAYNSGDAEYQVLWEYETSAGNRDLYRRRVSPGGELLGESTALAELGTEESAPAVAGDGEYGYLTAWEDSRNSAVSGRDLYAEFVEQFRFSGRVYAGVEGDTSQPLSGVTVELHCSNNQGGLGALVASTITDGVGWWGLPVTSVCEFHEVWMVDPQYHVADNATTVGGTVVAATWIEYPEPLRDKVLTGNLFFTVAQDLAPQPWVNFTPSGWWTTSLVAPVSVQISDIGTGLDVSTAESRMSLDGGGAWTGWSAASCSGSDGSKGPETVSTNVTFEADNGSDYFVQFAISDLALQRSESPVYPVKVDTTPPENPPSVGSNLSTGTWYGDSAITLDWQPATDATSGVAGYSFLWDTTASTTPDSTVEDQDNHIEDTIPGDGQNWFFHLRTVDNADNAAPGAVETGPYWLDTVTPTNPATITCTPAAGVWSASSTVTCTWIAGTDAASGVAGYSFIWGTAPTTEPDTSVNTTGLSATSTTLASNWWYLHLRTVDTVGNASWTEHVGPFKIDRTDPSSAVNSLAANQTTASFTVSWGGSDGTGSGIVSYDVKVEDITAGTTTTWKNATTAKSGTFTGQRGHSYIFASRARDLVGNLEPYPASGGDALTTIGASIPIRVRDQSGSGVSGAKVYHNGLYVGVTDTSGLRYVPGALVGDSVSALAKIYEQTAKKSSHGGWSWRVYLTSVGVDNTGTTSQHSISSASEQVLTVRKNQTLIGVHLVVSVQWDATTAFLTDLRQGLESASEYLYDATDGQFFWESIELKDNSVTLANADMRVWATNQVWPNADVGGIRDVAGKAIELGRLFDGESSNVGQWSQDNGFRTTIHEFGHYIGLWDEYLDRKGKKTATAFCTTNYNSKATDHTEQASIMYRQYESTEFCSRADSTHTHRSQTQHDAKTNGESTWETIKRYFKDTNNPERWTLRSPDDRKTVVAGPTALPVPKWSTTVITNANTSSCAPFTQVIRNSSGVRVNNVDVWLDRASPLADILQGKTDTSGEIAIYGAHNGDSLRAQITGASASATVSCAAATKASETAPEKAEGDEIQLEDDPFSLRVKLLPSGGSAARVVVTASEDLVSAPDVELQQMGVGDPVSIDVEWDAGESAWLADVMLDPGSDQTGVIIVRGTDMSANTVHRMNSFALTEAGPTQPPRIYSFDGVFELLLAEGSLTEGSVIEVHETDIGTSQQGDLRRVGNAYEVSVSTGEQIFLAPAVINIRYQGDQAEGLAPTGLQLYRWDSGTGLWVLEGGVSDADFNIVSAEVDRLSVFAVLGSTADIFSDGFESSDTDLWSSVTP